MPQHRQLKLSEYGTQGKRPTNAPSTVAKVKLSGASESIGSMHGSYFPNPSTPEQHAANQQYESRVSGARESRQRAKHADDNHPVNVWRRGIAAKLHAMEPVRIAHYIPQDTTDLVMRPQAPFDVDYKDPVSLNHAWRSLGRKL